jgi:hypothetical protein
MAVMVHDHPTWGQERIADELKLKLGIRVSPRTVSKYWSRIGPAEEEPISAIADLPLAVRQQHDLAEHSAFAQHLVRAARLF